MTLFQHVRRIMLLAFFLLGTASAFAQDEPIADSVIIAKIEAKIAMDQSLSIFKLNLDVTNGIVTITGNVNSDSDASAAIEIAQSTDGVKDVDASKLVIKHSSRPFADMAITAKVKGKFMEQKLFTDKDISALGISVETINGVVHLDGTVDNSLQADNAVKIAKSVSGVKSVESRIKIK